MHTLTAEQRATVEALAETMIPADALGPGARHAQVVRFIDRSLVFLDTREAFVAGLDATDEYALATRGARFAALDASSMCAVLSDVESGRATGFAAGDSIGFFRLLRTMVLEGMFGDPIYGGNADYSGWQLIGYPGHKWVVTPEEQRLDVDVQPTYPRGTLT